MLTGFEQPSSHKTLAAENQLMKQQLDHQAGQIKVGLLVYGITGMHAPSLPLWRCRRSSSNLRPSTRSSWVPSKQRCLRAAPVQTHPSAAASSVCLQLKWSTTAFEVMTNQTACCRRLRHSPSARGGGEASPMVLTRRHPHCAVSHDDACV